MNAQGSGSKTKIVSWTKFQYIRKLQHIFKLHIVYEKDAKWFFILK